MRPRPRGPGRAENQSWLLIKLEQGPDKGCIYRESGTIMRENTIYHKGEGIAYSARTSAQRRHWQIARPDRPRRQARRRLPPTRSPAAQGPATFSDFASPGFVASAPYSVCAVDRTVASWGCAFYISALLPSLIPEWKTDTRPAGRFYRHSPRAVLDRAGSLEDSRTLADRPGRLRHRDALRQTTAEAASLTGKIKETLEM